MQILKINPNYQINYTSLIQNKPQKEENKTTKPNYPMPTSAHYVSFLGYSTNLEQTLSHLDKEKFPPAVWQRAAEIIEEGNPEDKTLIDVHKEVFEDLNAVENVEELREFFPQFKDVKSSFDVKTSKNSFLDDVKMGKLEYFNPENDTTLDLVRLLYAEGFSTNDLKDYTGGKNITTTIYSLNIPLLNKDYAHVLKLSDKEYNKRLISQIQENRLLNADRRAQSNEPVFIPSKKTRKGQPLSPEHKAKISEGLKKYWAENPEKAHELSERQKEYFTENPEQREIFSRVLIKTWEKSPGIKKAMSKFFKKQGVENLPDDMKNLTTEQKACLKLFWHKNYWAKEIFGENMSKAWEEIKKQDSQKYEPPTIKQYPIAIMKRIEDFARKECGVQESLDFTLTYFTSLNYVMDTDATANGISEKFFELNPKMANILADVYCVTLVDCAKWLGERAKKLPPFSKERAWYEQASVDIVNELQKMNANGYVENKDLSKFYAACVARAIDRQDTEMVKFLSCGLDRNYTKYRNNPTWKED